MCVQFVRSKAVCVNTEQDLQMGAPCVNLPENLGGYHMYLKSIMIIVNLVAHTEDGT